jgi:putative flippase GtrA
VVILRSGLIMAEGIGKLVSLRCRDFLRALACPWIVQIFAFGLVGGIQLCVDWSIFVLLTHLGVDLALANILGRISGATLGFWLNGRITFAEKHRRLGAWQAVRFVVFWVGATLVSTVSVEFVRSHFDLHSAWMAKPLVEAILAVLSFFIAKFWIYR